MTLLEQLKRDEGFRAVAYRDSRGLVTIGYGWCVERRPISQRMASDILDEQLSETQAEIYHRWPWVGRDLDFVREAVLINMAFNLGVEGLAGFTRFLKAVQNMDWSRAANEMRDSVWYTQVGERAKRLAKQMVTGEWQ